jgi:hypothetical protein
VELQDTGFMWDLSYKGKVYKLHFLMAVLFVKCDTVEADHLCAKYQMRHGCVKHLCRYCHIGLQEADDHMAKPKAKTQAEIQKLVAAQDLEGLHALSQIYLLNAFHKVRFSAANERGIHGACPSEMLHALLLGIFRYVRDIFFSFIGKDSDEAKQINALAKEYCGEFGRQSDRSMPGTSFSKGIKGGKLMAKEYRGVLLIMMAILRSTTGREIIGQKKKFKDSRDIDDWILLVELLLEWEAFLNEKEMTVRHVKRLGKKHRYIMYVMRKVAKRTTGMGLKLMKFHAILHAMEDILLFGVPVEFDTAANESHHKPAKQAAKLTQMAASTFQFQTATRLVEFLLVDLAMEEIEHGGKVWEYFFGYSDSEEEEMSGTEEENGEEGPEIKTGEARIQVYEDEEGLASFKLLSRSKYADNTSWNTYLVQFLVALQAKVSEHLVEDSLPIYTCHKRGDQIFRGHPNFRGNGAWKDWVLVDWGTGERELPCHIWCFVVLKNLPQGRNGIEHGGIKLREDGVYAVVECCTLETDEEELGRSELMYPIHKTVDLDEDGYVTNRSFFLANTEAFVGPCCVIADLGGPSNRYFAVKPRPEWAPEFARWLDLPHDEMDPIVDEFVDDNVEEVEEEEVVDKGKKVPEKRPKKRTRRKSA